MTIAVLGWGSLIWDPQELELADSAWHADGPRLPIEFARVSEPDPSTRLQRLTLVLHGGAQKVHTLWARSASDDFSHACENLRGREKCNLESIGYVHRDSRQRLTAITHNTDKKRLLDELERWRDQKNFDAVIWTDLPSKGFTTFTADMAVELLREWRLNNVAGEAEKYVRFAPAQVRTEVRKRVEQEFQWFSMIPVLKPLTPAANGPDPAQKSDPEPTEEMDLESAKLWLPELDQALKSGFVSYSQLVRAKWGIEDPLPTDDPSRSSKRLQAANKTLYPSVLKVFQESHGTIVDDYCKKVIWSAVARTSPPNGATSARTPKRAQKPDFHFVYDLAAVRIGDDLLSRIDMLAANASRLLNGQPLINFMDQLYSKTTDLLGIVERLKPNGEGHDTSRKANGSNHGSEEKASPATPPRQGTPSVKRSDAEPAIQDSDKHKVALIKDDLNAIELNYLVTRARLDYLLGAFACSLSIVGLVAVGYGIGINWLVRDTSLGLVLVLGTLGAFVSVVQRVNNNSLKVRYDLGHGYTILLGATRPLIGAFAGFLIWILVQAQVVENPTKSIFFLGALALAAGIAERSVGDIVTQTGILGGLSTGDSRSTTGAKPNDGSGGQ